ncbi:MAG: hypothetical protein ACNS60_19940 [Candidatus Cyclobacteriaceae bacterium M2_1C_046]
MSSLSDLALRGHFEELKNKFEKKGMAKAGKDSDSLLKALKKAVGTIEDMYEKYPGSLTPAHRKNYRSLIKTLRRHGSTYTGHPDLINLDDVTSYSKKPMQKANSTVKENKKQQKTG